MSGISISKYCGLYQGLPAASGTLNVYQTGTTTPVTPYADAALMTPLSNPITLDANGCAVFYYSGTVNLKLVAYTASGSLIETLDPVYPNGSGTSGSSATVPWVAAGGTADIITATYNPVITALSDGLLLSFRASAANTTTTPTFSPNGLTAYTITQKGGAALIAGSISANLAEYLVRYNLANMRWELLNPAISSGINSITANSPITNSTTAGVSTLGLAAANTYQATPSNPTGTASATQVMMGLAGAITPATTGRILIMISGDANNTNTTGTVVQIRYGTSTAPTNGAAATGTAVGGAPLLGLHTNFAADTVGFAVQAIVTGLTPSTAYWIDLGVAAPGGATSKVENLSISAYEIK